jgi:hypothetical protein
LNLSDDRSNLIPTGRIGATDTQDSWQQRERPS